MINSIPTLNRFCDRYLRAVIFKESRFSKDNEINLYQMLLPRHLFIEEILFDICSSYVKDINALRNARLSFYQLYCLTKSFYPDDPEEWVWTACEKLNSIRNNLAHRLETESTEDKLRDFVNYVDKHHDRDSAFFIRKSTDTSSFYDLIYHSLNCVIMRLLMIFVPDEFKTYGEKLIEKWTIDGTLSPPPISEEQLLGTYGSVSESEWHLELKLEPDNLAVITSQHWDVEDHENIHSFKDITEAKWKSEGALITLRYDDVEDILCYDNSVPLAELGKNGGAPGISQAAPFSEKSIIGRTTVWKMPFSFWGNGRE